MAINLHDPSLTPNKIHNITNQTSGVLEVIGHINGTPADSLYLTLGSMATFQSDGTTWHIIGLYYRPTITQQDVPGTPITIASDPTETDLGINISFPVRGIYLATGTFNFEHTMGNNVDIAGALLFRLDSDSSLVLEIPWGYGRLSQFADLVINVSEQADNQDGSFIGESISVFATNRSSSGTLNLNSPAHLDVSGPY